MKFKRIWECWLLGLVPLNSSVQGMESGIQQISMDNKKEKQMFELFPSRVAFASNNKEVAEKQDFSKIVYQMGDMSMPQPLHKEIAEHFNQIFLSRKLDERIFWIYVNYAIMFDVLAQSEDIRSCSNLSYPLEMIGLKEVSKYKYVPIDKLNEFNLDCINKVLVRTLVYCLWYTQYNAPTDFTYKSIEDFLVYKFASCIGINHFCEYRDEYFLGAALRDSVAIAFFLLESCNVKPYYQFLAKNLYETVDLLSLDKLPQIQNYNIRAPLPNCKVITPPCIWEIDYSPLMQKYLYNTPNISQEQLMQSLTEEFFFRDKISCTPKVDTEARNKTQTDKNLDTNKKLKEAEINPDKIRDFCEKFPARKTFLQNNIVAFKKGSFSKIVYQTGGMSEPQSLHNEIASHFRQLVAKQLNFYACASYAIMLDILAQGKKLQNVVNLSYPLEMLGLKMVGLYNYEPIGELNEFNLDCINKVLVRQLMWDVWQNGDFAPENFDVSGIATWLSRYKDQFTRLEKFGKVREPYNVDKYLRDTIAVLSFLDSAALGSMSHSGKLPTIAVSKKPSKTEKLGIPEVTRIIVSTLCNVVDILELGKLSKLNWDFGNCNIKATVPPPWLETGEENLKNPFFVEIDPLKEVHEYLLGQDNVDQKILRQMVLREFRCEDFISDKSAISNQKVRSLDRIDWSDCSLPGPIPPDPKDESIKDIH